MKIKLLKKLRKRYNWYFNKDKFPVLIDHLEKTATVYDLEYVSGRAKYTMEDVKEKVKVDHTEWALRMMKLDTLKKWGWEIGKSTYRLATRKYNKKLTK